MIRRHLLPLLFLLLSLASGHAIAIDISEQTVNDFVTRKLAERKQRDVQVSNPKIHLLDGYATLCATLHSRYVPDAVDFCANMTPKWRKETASLLATQMSLISFNAPGLRADDAELLKTLLNQVFLPRLEGFELYAAEDGMGKLISDVQVRPGRLDISM